MPGQQIGAHKMPEMTWRSFMIANVISGILWAPIYLLPGMAFGASLEIAARVAAGWRR